MIYFIQAANNPDGLVKIGYSEDPKARLKELQSSSPELLHIIETVKGDRYIEGMLHWYFKYSRLHGEWFNFDYSDSGDRTIKMFLEDEELREKILIQLKEIAQLKEESQLSLKRKRNSPVNQLRRLIKKRKESQKARQEALDLN